MEYEIIPAILTEDFDSFAEHVSIAEEFAQTIQWDVMDGQFVEAITFNNPAELKNLDTGMTIEAHMMVENPEEMFEGLSNAGVDRVIVHAEAVEDLPAILMKMDEYGFQKGVALNPETDIDDIKEVIHDLDVVLIMTVIPGASGQSFMDEQLDKVSDLRADYPELNIAVDGGVNMDTLKKAKEAGANRFGINSAIFESPDPVNAFEVLSSQLG